jgi:asparagine synthase (glutamine-hydrolysing)
MSGAFFVDTAPGDDVRATADLLAGQLAHGGEQVNHFAVDGTAVLGAVSHDKFRQGTMPVYMKESGVWGVLLGELHECDALRALKERYGHHRSDLKLIAAAWRDGALEDTLPHLNGAFFVLLWDPTSRTLAAANDRYGLYPMYWAHNGGRFCLASRVLCSVLAGVVDGEWNAQCLANLLTLDDMLGEATMVKGVSTYPQATILTKKDDDLHWNRYWSYEYANEPPSDSFETLAREAGLRLKEAVRRQTRRAERIGVTLSGGLDSRCLAAAADHAGVTVETSTWGMKGCYDRRFAKRVAALYGMEHHDHDYNYGGFESRFAEGARSFEAMANLFDAHMLAHVHLLDEHSDCILNGYAGGLVLGGSFLKRAWMDPIPDEELEKRLFAWRNTLLREEALKDALGEGVTLETDDYPSHFYREALARIEGHSPPNKTDRFFLENRQRRLTAMGTVLMRLSVESAAGFFDYDLMDLMLRLPPEWRIDHRFYLAMMRMTFPEAGMVPWERTLLSATAPEWLTFPARAALKVSRVFEGSLGWPRIAARQSPVDFARWLRGPMKNWMNEVICSRDDTADEALSAAFCERVWKEHLAGTDRTRLVGAIAAIRGFAQALARARKREPASTHATTEVTR